MAAAAAAAPLSLSPFACMIRKRDCSSQDDLDSSEELAFIVDAVAAAAVDDDVAAILQQQQQQQQQQTHTLVHVTHNPVSSSSEGLINRAASWNDALPAEIRWHIVGMLNRFDRLVMRCVCREYRFPVNKQLDMPPITCWLQYAAGKCGSLSLVKWLEQNRHLRLMPGISMQLLNSVASVIIKHDRIEMIPWFLAHLSRLPPGSMQHFRYTALRVCSVAMAKLLMSDDFTRDNPRARNWRRMLWHGAARSENLELLDYLHQQGIAFKVPACAEVLTRGLDKSFRWLIQHGYSFNHMTSLSNVQSKYVRELYQHGYKMPRMTKNAIRDGDLKLMEWIYQTWPDKIRAIASVAEVADVAEADGVDAAVVANAADWEFETDVRCMVRYGRTEFLDWARSKGLYFGPPDKLGVGDAPNLETFQWLITEYPDLTHTAKVCEAAIEKQNLHWLKLAHSLGWPLPANAMSLLVGHAADRNATRTPLQGPLTGEAILPMAEWIHSVQPEWCAAGGASRFEQILQRIVSGDLIAFATWMHAKGLFANPKKKMPDDSLWEHIFLTAQSSQSFHVIEYLLKMKIIPTRVDQMYHCVKKCYIECAELLYLHGCRHWDARHALETLYSDPHGIHRGGASNMKRWLKEHPPEPLSVKEETKKKKQKTTAAS